MTELNLRTYYRTHKRVFKKGGILYKGSIYRTETDIPGLELLTGEKVNVVQYGIQGGGFNMQELYLHPTTEQSITAGLSSTDLIKIIPEKVLTA